MVESGDSLRGSVSVASASGDESEVSKSASPPPPKLFLELPDKTKEAVATFTLLQQSKYRDAKLGSCGRQTEDMTCDCRESVDPDTGANLACGEDSDCINRLTSVECLDDTCSCGSECQNQRFQRMQYPHVSVIKTEHKGYGLRADEELSADTFIYEYVGEVVDEPSFRERMIEYDNQGLKHFYFMMLQKGEFIDATKAGCLARFCNHSCSPNAYVDKWVVGRKLRMGIFAKRKILKGEEITFDYNVDRYGAQAQKCYCGEPNCIGFIGGKTQTDSARILPHTIAEALAVTSSQEKEWLKLMKQKGIKRSEDDAVNTEFIESLELKPVQMEDVPKITGCLLQPNLDFIVMEKIVDRVVATEDADVLARISRVHGVEAFSTVLKNILSGGSDESTDLEKKLELSEKEEQLVSKVLRLMAAWPPMKYRNRIVNSQVEVYLEAISGRFNEELTGLATQLLAGWKQLPMEFKIPKRANSESAARDDPLADLRRTPSKPNNDSRRYEGKLLPEGWQWATDPNTGNVYFYNKEKNLTQWDRPVVEALPKGPKAKPDDKKKLVELDKKRKERKERANDQDERRRQEELRKLELEELKRKMDLADIIAQAKAQQESLERERSEQPTPAKQRQPADYERMWEKALAGVVPNMLKKYEKQIGHDNLKLCAREIVKTLASKEIKRHGQVAPPQTFDDEKRAKMKGFIKPYMEKFVAKLEVKRQRKRSQSAAGPDAKRAKE